MKTNFTIGMGLLCSLLTCAAQLKATGVANQSVTSIQDSSGCNLNIVLNTTTSCGAGGSISATLDGGTVPYAYLWNDGTTELTLSNLPGGEYSLIVVDANGCDDTAIAIIQLEETLDPNASTTMGLCGLDNNSIHLYPIGGTPPYSYEWSNGGTSSHLYPIPSGIYELTLTDANGCTAHQVYTLTNTGNMAAVPIIYGDTCAESSGSVTVIMSGGSAPFSYSWSTGDTGSILTDLSAGYYELTVTDSLDCIATLQVVIPGTPKPYLTFNVINTDCGVEEGAIYTVATGATEPYTFEWSSGASSVSILDLGAGAYFVTVTDSLGCQSLDTAQVLLSSFPALTNINTTTATCGYADAFIDMTVSGGTMPYTYNWSNGATTDNLDSVSAGLYSVTVLTADGCMSIDSTQIFCESEFLTINAIDQTSSFSLYPNPAIDETFISSRVLKGSVSVNVYNTSGSLMLTVAGVSSQTIRINMADLAPGIYIIEVSDTASRYIQPLVKE